jgi:S-adenosylmethionine decarboxylase
MSKISLHGFNNLTKSLSFSLYKLHYLKSNQAQRDYNAYINEHFCADKLAPLLVRISHAIGGNVLNVASQDYQPQGASVTLMISEEAQPAPLSNVKAESLVAHLDKSHLCIHTYPEEAPQEDIAIFRADIELSTCGVISPLEVLDYVIEEFNPDVVDIDYRIRGMTRSNRGEMLFIDDNLQNISDYLSTRLKASFTIEDHNLTAHNLFHTKLSKTKVNLNDYLFEDCINEISIAQQRAIKVQIEQALKQLFTHSTPS